MLLSFALFLIAVVCSLVLGHSLIGALLLGLGLFSYQGLRRGFSPRQLAAMAWEKGKSSLLVLQVFLLIGTVTALWRSGGTISFFLYYGLRSIPPGSFLLWAFLLSALLSFALGTSFGVTGTAGVVLITLARSGGADLAMTAGAILSGAYFGDRCSPMSSCATLVAAVTGTELYPNVREMLRTAALPTALSAAIFALLSHLSPLSSADPQVLHALSAYMTLSGVVLLPAVCMLLLPLLRVPVKYAMALSAAIAFVLTVAVQGATLGEAVHIAVFGFAPQQAALRSILSGGGLFSMLDSAAVVFITSLYAGILEGIHALDAVHHWVDRMARRLGLYPAMIFVSVALAAVFCNQSVTVLLGVQLLERDYRAQGQSPTVLAMDMANSGVTLAGLVPWSIAISVPLSMLDVGMEAIVWCVLLYMIPLCYLPTRRFFLKGQNRGLERKNTL